jgi:hypothetical protein
MSRRWLDKRTGDHLALDSLVDILHQGSGDKTVRIRLPKTGTTQCYFAPRLSKSRP